MLPFELKKWYVLKGDQKQGPLSVVDLQALLKQRQVSPQDLVVREGISEGRPMNRIPELRLLFETAETTALPAQPDEEAEERTMVAEPKPPRSIPKQPERLSQESEDLNENEKTQLMTSEERAKILQARSKIKKNQTTPSPPKPEPPRQKSEPEIVQSLKLESPTPLPSRVETPRIEMPSISKRPPPPTQIPIPTPTPTPIATSTPARVEAPPPPRVETPPKPSPAHGELLSAIDAEEETVVEAVVEPAEPPPLPRWSEPETDSLGINSGITNITYTNPFIRNASGTYKRKKPSKPIPPHILVGLAALGLLTLTGMLFYKLMQPPGEISATIPEAVTKPFTPEEIEADVLPQELKELEFAQKPAAQSYGAKIAVGRSTDKKSTIKFFVGTDLPGGTRLILSLEPYQNDSTPVFLRRFVVDATQFTTIDTGIQTSKIHPGEYYLSIVEDELSTQPRASAAQITKSKTTPRRIPAIREPKYLIFTRRYNFN